MNINLSAFSQFTVSFMKESILLFLTTQQRKILITVAIVLGRLAACYDLSDGTQMTQQLYLKAPELDPSFASAYFHLETTLPRNSGSFMKKPLSSILITLDLELFIYNFS